MQKNAWTGGFAAKACIRGLAAIALMAGLSGCSQTQDALGLTKSAPDEFQVFQRAPLSLPPNFALRPPEPGAPRPQEGTARDRAESAVFGEAGTSSTQTAMFGNLTPGGALGGGTGGTLGGDYTGGTARPTGPSSGEQALLAEAGAMDANPEIRAVIERETAALVEQDSDFVERLIFWRDPEPFGTVVDPAEEEQRIQENAALGKPVTAGETPTIEPKKRAPLEGLF
ncbi:DUF3035 domain-containing protein [Rhodospirillaceae bacterium SYSU D60014]|uniref:DUF3035 domain-containing protein n=1 Tax=Virgifigura deserti TaxID=2268457 RepID=UPI000E66EA87